jgi:hypothetical protein
MVARCGSPTKKLVNPWVKRKREEVKISSEDGTFKTKMIVGMDACKLSFLIRFCRDQFVVLYNESVC